MRTRSQAVKKPSQAPSQGASLRDSAQSALDTNETQDDNTATAPKTSNVKSATPASRKKQQAKQPASNRKTPSNIGKKRQAGQKVTPAKKRPYARKTTKKNVSISIVENTTESLSNGEEETVGDSDAQERSESLDNGEEEGQVNSNDHEQSEPLANGEEEHLENLGVQNEITAADEPMANSDAPEETSAADETLNHPNEQKTSTPADESTTKNDTHAPPETKETNDDDLSHDASSEEISAGGQVDSVPQVQAASHGNHVHFEEDLTSTGCKDETKETFQSETVPPDEPKNDKMEDFVEAQPNAALIEEQPLEPEDTKVLQPQTDNAASLSIEEPENSKFDVIDDEKSIGDRGQKSSPQPPSAHNSKPDESNVDSFAPTPSRKRTQTKRMIDESPAEESPVKRNKTSQVKKKQPVRGNWSLEHLLQNSKSKLTSINLSELLSHPRAWSELSTDEQSKLTSMLPNCTTTDPSNDDPLPNKPRQYLKNNSSFQADVRLFQEDLAAGRYDPQWLADAQKASDMRANGEFDAWKEQNREEFWGQKQKTMWDALAGESSKHTIEDLVSAGSIMVGDVWLFQRGAGHGGIKVEKEATIFEITGKNLPSFTYPPSQHKFSSHANGEDLTLEEVRSPMALWNAIVAEDGRVTTRCANAWKDFRCFRKNQDMGNLFDVRELYHTKLG